MIQPLANRQAELPWKIPTYSSLRYISLDPIQTHDPIQQIATHPHPQTIRENAIDHFYVFPAQQRISYPDIFFEYY